MPIVDICFVAPEPPTGEVPSAQALADGIGRALGSPPGRTWVRLSTLPASRYAENEAAVPTGGEPVFITLTLAHPPSGDALDAWVIAVIDAVAGLCHRPRACIHLEVAPPAAGRIAFGGQWVR